MTTWTDSFFYIAFLGQIFVISWYFPEKVLTRMRYVLKTYPPERYPKLYPQSIEHYRIGHAVFRAATRIVMAIGFIILVLVMFVVDHATFADDGYISEFWPALYGVIQFLPLIALEISEFGQMKLMRKADVSSTRTADLRPRRLFDHIPPQVLGLAVVAIAAAILVDLYVHDFEVHFGHDTMQRAMVLIATNGLLVALGAWLLYGRKPNPHQAAEDRARHVSATLTSFAYCSMIMSMFFAVTAIDDVFDIDFLDAAIMSLYFQAVVALSLGFLLRSQPLEKMNFDVYKENGTATA